MEGKSCMKRNWDAWAILAGMAVIAGLLIHSLSTTSNRTAALPQKEFSGSSAAGAEGNAVDSAPNSFQVSFRDQCRTKECEAIMAREFEKFQAAKQVDSPRQLGPVTGSGRPVSFPVVPAIRESQPGAVAIAPSAPHHQIPLVLPAGTDEVAKTEARGILSMAKDLYVWTKKKMAGTLKESLKDDVDEMEKYVKKGDKSGVKVEIKGDDLEAFIARQRGAGGEAIDSGDDATGLPTARLPLVKPTRAPVRPVAENAYHNDDMDLDMAEDFFKVSDQPKEAQEGGS